MTIYVWPDSPPFPVPPPDALQSQEPADTESLLRRSYFTNYTRDQVIEHYKTHFDREVMLRMNYRPEDAQTIIRDQTRSYYLEELVHPMRESLFINGFIAQNAKDDIWIEGKHWEQKLTIKYVSSSKFWRILIIWMAMGVFYILVNEWLNEIRLFERSRNNRGKA